MTSRITESSRLQAPNLDRVDGELVADVKPVGNEGDVPVRLPGGRGCRAMRTNAQAVVQEEGDLRQGLRTRPEVVGKVTRPERGDDSTPLSRFVP